MAERPILFSGPMVRALLNGTKTQTRRAIKPRGRLSLFDGSWSDDYVLDPGNAGWREAAYRWRVGDRLWVREAWARSDKHDFLVAYRADGACGAWGWDGDGKLTFNRHGLVLDPERRDGKGEWGLGKFGGKWRPSIHMPRWASRITLEVTGVKVERLQDISEEDARAEGAQPVHMQPGGPKGDPGAGWISYVEGFRQIWSDINGPGSWDANPWVVAISFRRIEPTTEARHG